MLTIRLHNWWQAFAWEDYFQLHIFHTINDDDANASLPNINISLMSKDFFMGDSALISDQHFVVDVVDINI